MGTLPTPAEEEGLLEEIVRTKLAIKELQEKLEMMTGFIKDNPEYYPVGKKQVGRFYIQVSEGRRVDDALAKKNLGSVYKNVTKEVVDPIKAKAFLTPEAYTSIQKVYANRVEVGFI